MLSKIKEYDFYRKIPKDLTETTFHGSVLSICASIFMLILFIAELWAFLTTQIVTNVVIDPNTDSLLRINFNITVLDMPCEFATIDVIDVLGTRNDNVTKNVNKWQVDEFGIRRGYEGRNFEQKDILHDIHHDVDSLVANGIHVLPIDDGNFKFFVENHDYVFVDFYAPWCICIVNVDCVANKDLCSREKIMAFPTLRLFKKDRTVDALTEFVKSRLAIDEQLERLDPQAKALHKERLINERKDHPG
eukprot:gene18993-24810_t